MELLLLTAIIAAVASSPLTQYQDWPWQVGKEYVYNVDSYTWTKFELSENKGNAFKTQFNIRVLAAGRLVAKLENPTHALIQGQEINEQTLPSDLQFQPVEKFDQSFEIYVEGGRVLSLKVPTSLSLSYENLLKGLVSALQVDLSSYGYNNSFPNSFVKDSFQGLFTKTEADVTGDCDTLYSVSPVSAEWRRELPEFVKEDPVEIVKSKDFESCQKRVAYTFGVPEGYLWNGIAYKNDEKQFIKHTSESRILAGKQGTIYKSETLSSVSVNPLIFGKQKAEVYSVVRFYLSSVQPKSDAQWQKSTELRNVESLLFTMNEATFAQLGEQNVVYAQKLLQEITPLLNNPDKLSETNFLSKFNNLVRFIYTMNSEQLGQMTSSLEVARTSKNIAKNKMWLIYRDAVAQAGTIAAFKEIKNWILTQKIQRDDAAEVISSLSSILQYRSREILNEFFEFALDPKVQEQSDLNTTVLLAATKVFRLSKDDKFIVETVIPRLSQELKQAIETDDKNKAQVYVRVLGNLAHPDIIKVFAPYLEGKINVTKYLRTQIIISLKTLANTRNKYVRALLFSILRNTAEPYEVRVAAALNIFLTYPTAEMFQIMALMTNYDPSTQVRAVLTTSITFAAGLKDPRFAELAKNAQSVLSKISKEKFGYRYSSDSIIDEYTSYDNIAHFREVSYIGSVNNLLPVYQRGALRFRSTGWTEENWFTLSISDVQHLMEYITELYYDRRKVDTDFKFSAEKIIEILNIKREHRCHLEGSFFLDNWNQQTLLTFNQDDFETLKKKYLNFLAGFSKGYKDQFTKILNNRQVLVAFPLAMGVPFLFDYSEPIVFVSQISGKYDAPKTSTNLENLSLDIQFTYVRNLEGTVGFWDTFGDVYANAGIINKLQFHIPSKLTLIHQSTYNKIKMEFPEQNANLIHMSVWPYTSLQKTNSILAVLDDPSTKLVKRPEKVLSSDLKFGQLTGAVFQLQGNSYSSDYKDLTTLFDADLLTNVRNLLYQNDVALTQFDLKYLAKESQNKAVVFSLYFDTLYNQKVSGEIGPAAVITDITPNSQDRTSEIIKRAATGIESAKVQVVDFSTVFEGKQKVEYVFTSAFASSFVDNKVQAALFARGTEQINAVFQIVKPATVPLNLKKALEKPLKVTYKADVKYGNTENVYLKGFGERTDKYTEQLKKDPLAKKCLQEMSKDNIYQKDCYKTIIKAHAPDYFKATVTYKDLNPIFYNLTFDAYEIFRETFSFEKEVDFLNTIDGDKFEIEAQAYYYDNYVNYDFVSKYGKFSLKNVEGMQYYPYAMAFYQPLNNWERARNWFTGYQNLPYCAVDDNKIWTFSGRSYDYSLTSSWHVVMVDESNNEGKWTDLVILARRPSEKQEEVYVSYKNEYGDTLELEIKPASVNVKTNAKKVNEGPLTAYWSQFGRAPFLEYYTLPDGIVIFSIDNGNLRFIYDNQRFVIFTDGFRSTTRGICGQSSTQISDDYLTPWGLVDKPEYYGASFSLDGEFSDPKTAELKKEAKQKAYQPVTKFTNILSIDDELSKAENQSVKGL